MSLIFLVGMPGSGKTHWGRIWSKAYGFDFADLDDEIEAQAGLIIPDIFKSVGEDGFRELEASVLLHTIAATRDHNTVVATGGGTASFNGNLPTMLRAGCVVYLRATTDTILGHIRHNDVSRPLLHHPDAGSLEKLLRVRQPFYERAHITVDVEQIATDTFAQILNECTDRRL